MTITGATLVVVSLAPDLNVGMITNSMLGIVFVLLSPVFYTFDDAPKLFKWLGFISPFRYAADAIEKGFNGQNPSFPEMGVLAGTALVSMALGTIMLRWKDL